jgi:hypothetical protein
MVLSLRLLTQRLQQRGGGGTHTAHRRWWHGAWVKTPWQPAAQESGRCCSLTRSHSALVSCELRSVLSGWIQSTNWGKMICLDSSTWSPKILARIITLIILLNPYVGSLISEIFRFCLNAKVGVFGYLDIYHWLILLMELLLIMFFFQNIRMWFPKNISACDFLQKKKKNRCDSRFSS